MYNWLDIGIRHSKVSFLKENNFIIDKHNFLHVKLVLRLMYEGLVQDEGQTLKVLVFKINDEFSWKELKH